MHELAVTESILTIVVRHAEDSGAARIVNVWLVLGELSSIVDDSVQFYWDIISKETIAQGAVLHFRRIPAEMQCQACGERYEIAGRDDFACPACGSLSAVIVAGEEFYVEAIDVETEPAQTPTGGANAC